MENPIKMDDLGGFPPIFGNTQMYATCPWKNDNPPSRLEKLRIFFEVFPHLSCLLFFMFETNSSHQTKIMEIIWIYSWWAEVWHVYIYIYSIWIFLVASSSSLQ